MKVIKRKSGDLLQMGEEEYEARLTHNYELGIVGTYEDLAKHYSIRSGEAFAAKLDHQATFYRNLSEDTERRAVELRRNYTEKAKKLKATFPEVE